MSTEPKLPSDDLQHIQFEGCDVCVIAPEDFDALARERDELRVDVDIRARHVKALKEELDTLRAQLHDIKTEFVRTDIECADLRAQLRASREALAKYGKHANDCRSWGHVGTPGNYRCTCGLDAALQSTPQLAKNEGEKPSTNAHIHGIKS